MTTQEDCKKLKRFGFMWMNDGTSDKVDADCIADVVPAAKGFTVIYNDKSVLKASTAVVNKIEFPDEGKEMTIWAVVHWESIEDERR